MEMEIEMQILSNLSTQNLSTHHYKKIIFIYRSNPQTFIYKSYVGKFGELYG